MGVFLSNMSFGKWFFELKDVSLYQYISRNVLCEPDRFVFKRTQTFVSVNRFLVVNWHSLALP